MGQSLIDDGITPKQFTSSLTPEWFAEEKKILKKRHQFPSKAVRLVRDTFLTPYLGEDFVNRLGIGDVRYLNGADNVFISYETPWTKMTVSGIYMFPSPMDPEIVKAQLAGYIARHGENVICKVVKNDDGTSRPFKWFGRPYFELDENFDMDAHFKVVNVPAPGDDRAIERICSKFMSEDWDYDRPLWKCYYLQGIKGEKGEDECALWWPAHHALGDGQAFVRALLSYVATLDPVTGLPPPVANRGDIDISSMQYRAGNLYGKKANGKAAVEDSNAKLGESGVNEVAPESKETNGTANGHAEKPSGANRKSRREPKTLYDKYITPLIATLTTLMIVGYTIGIGVLLALWNLVSLVLFARRKSMWNPRGFVVEKQIAYSKKISMDDVKFAKSALGCTVNDLLLTAVNLALANFLASKNALKDETFTYLIPTSLRASGDASLSNQSSCWLVSLPSGKAKRKTDDGSDVLEMLKVVAYRMRMMKKSLEPVLFYYVMLVANFFPHLSPRPADHPWMLKLNRVISPLTNVPGPLTPVRWAGHTMTRYIGFIPPSANGMGLAIMSYAGFVSLGVNMDHDVLADTSEDSLYSDGNARKMVEFFEKALEELFEKAKEVAQAKKALAEEKKAEDKKVD